jgi:hypothetical protein
MTDLVPYSFQSDLLPSPQGALLPGEAEGVYITLPPEMIETLAATFERWFVGRPEVAIVDVGTSDKQGLGFILMEWSECEIDPLFLAILREEELIVDYTAYGRALEG